MRLTLAEIEKVVNQLGSAMTYAKEARRVARKVYGNDDEVSLNLKYVYADIQKVTHILEHGDDIT